MGGSVCCGGGGGAVHNRTGLSDRKIVRDNILSLQVCGYRSSRRADQRELSSSRRRRELEIGDAEGGERKGVCIRSRRRAEQQSAHQDSGKNFQRFNSHELPPLFSLDTKISARWWS